MSEATLRAAVKAAVNGVTNIGQVYDRQPWAAEMSAYLDLFKTRISSTDQIRGWSITHEGADASQLAIKKLVRRVYTYRIRGYLGLDDSAETEKTFAALVESVMNALDDDTTLHASGAHVAYSNLESFGHIVFGSVLCHYVEIVQQVAENRTAAV